MYILIQLLSCLGGGLLLYNFYRTAHVRDLEASSETSLRYVVFGSFCLMVSAVLAGVAGFFLLDLFWFTLASLSLLNNQKNIPLVGYLSLLTIAASLSSPGLLFASTAFIQTLGVLGGILVVIAWHGDVKGYLPQGSRNFNALNLAGALILLFVGVATQVWGTVLLDAFWAAIALRGLIREQFDNVEEEVELFV